MHKASIQEALHNAVYFVFNSLFNFAKFLKKGSIYLFWHGRLILFTNINILLLVYNDLTYPRYSFQVSVLIVFIESLKFNCQKHKISISWSRPFFNFFFVILKVTVI